MQVFTPAKSVRGLKSEFELKTEEVPQHEPNTDLSWRAFYVRPPSLVDCLITRLDHSLSPVSSTQRKADVSHKDVQQLVCSRLKVLRYIHHAMQNVKTGNMGNERKHPSGLSQEEEILMQWNAESTVSNNESRDSLSFYLCALGLSASEESWEWFRRVEEALLRARLTGLRHAEREALYRQHGIILETVDPRKELARGNVSAEETDLYRSLLILENRFSTKPRGQVSAPQSEGMYIQTESFHIESSSASMWYKTRLALALDPVRRRDVLLHAGCAYVQAAHLFNTFVTNYRKRIDNLIDLAQDQRTNLARSQWSYFLRIIDTLCNIDEIPRMDAVHDVNPVLGVVKPQDIDFLAKKHFPPCMQQLQEQLNRDGHLKYHGRWQYGLFLKRIGLSMEDALDFFGSKETMGLENFRKSRYGYSIRHYYGQEGKHTNYSTMGCTAIIMGAPPTPASCHGCPFKHEETRALKKTISAQCPSATEEDIEDIVQAREGQHFSRACFHYFKLNRPSYTGENLFSSPYEYYVASTSAIKVENEEK